MAKVLYLIDQPLDDRNYERWGLQIWIDSGWDVEVWDLTPYSHPRTWRDFRDSGRNLRTFDGYVAIKGARHFEAKLAELVPLPCYVDFTGNDLSQAVKVRLKALGAVRIICEGGSIPQPGDSRPSRMQFRAGRFFDKGVVEAGKSIARTIRRKMARHADVAPGLVVVSGEKARRTASESRGNAAILAAHNLDYDLYLKLRQHEPLAAGDFAVFIDEDMCFHPDFTQLGVPAPATAERYFPSVRKGLRAIADALMLDVRVAAHPLSTYWRRSPAYFGGIQIEYGKTAELIRDSRVAICHFSTAVQLAVLFAKPIVVVTTDELERTPSAKHIAELATALGKNVINLDGDIGVVDWQRELFVDRKRYDDYRNEYIKIDGSPELPFWRIVVDHIENEMQSSVGALTALDRENMRLDDRLCVPSVPPSGER